MDEKKMPAGNYLYKEEYVIDDLDRMVEEVRENTIRNDHRKLVEFLEWCVRDQREE